MLEMCYSDPTVDTAESLVSDNDGFSGSHYTVTDASSYIYNISPGISSRYRSTLGVSLVVRYGIYIILRQDIVLSFILSV